MAFVFINASLNICDVLESVLNIDIKDLIDLIVALMQ